MEFVQEAIAAHPRILEQPFPISSSSVGTVQTLVGKCPALARQTGIESIRDYYAALLAARENGVDVHQYPEPAKLREVVYRWMLVVQSPLLFVSDGADQFIRELTQRIPSAGPSDPVDQGTAN